MNKFQLKIFFKAAYEIILVFLQFSIISLHFFKWKFIPEKQIIQVTPFSEFVGFLIILIALIILLVAIKDLGRNLSPFPKPIKNSNLVTKGIYRFTRHPMYYSLIFISLGVFITKLSIYYLFLSICLGLII
ncbi:isoprenylcysteine carboxylmethyltransferase family protein, partial [uncultured Prochlorococcus sp.]|uniref:methyltransferase family protein n=1 Tax=uncultured Prochlorococcus sp. TaxID=159733 RepID=UPI0025889518